MDDGMDSAVICEISGKLLEFVPTDLRRFAQRVKNVRWKIYNMDDEFYI